MSLRLQILIRRMLFVLVSIVLSALLVALVVGTLGPSYAVEDVFVLHGFVLCVFALLGLYSIIDTKIAEWRSGRKWRQFETQSLTFWEWFLRDRAPTRDAAEFTQWCLLMASKIPTGPLWWGPTQNFSTHSQALACDSRVDDILMRSVAALMMLQKFKALNLAVLPGWSVDGSGNVMVVFRLPIEDSKDFLLSVAGHFSFVRAGNVVTVTVTTYPLSLVKRRVRAARFADTGWVIRRPWIQSDAKRISKELVKDIYALPFAWIVVLPSLLISVCKNHPFSNAFIREGLPIAAGRSVDWAYASGRWPIQERFTPDILQQILPLDKLVFARLIDAVSDMERGFAVLAAELTASSKNDPHDYADFSKRAQDTTSSHSESEQRDYDDARKKKKPNESSQSSPNAKDAARSTRAVLSRLYGVVLLLLTVVLAAGAVAITAALAVAVSNKDIGPSVALLTLDIPIVCFTLRCFTGAKTHFT